MRCVECGTVGGDADVFCGHCGASLRSQSTGRSTSAAEQPTTEPVAFFEPAPSTGSPSDRSRRGRLRDAAPRTLAAAITLILIAAVTVAAPRLAERRSAGALPAPTGERWRAELGTEPSFRFTNLGTGVQPFQALVADEERVYAAGAGLVAAYDAASGTRRWQRVLPNPGQPTLAGPVLVIDTARGPVALDRATGEVRWEAPVVGVERFTTDGEDRILLSRSADITAVDATDGTMMWSVPTFPGPDTGFAVADRDTVVVATSGNAVIRALHADTGDLRWEQRHSGAILTPPALVDGLVYVQDGDGDLHAFDAQTGDETWAHTPERDDFGPLTAGSGVVVRWSFEGRHVALNAATGRELWSWTWRAFQAGFAHAGLVIAPERAQGRVRALDARTGQERWVTTGIFVSGVTAAGDGLYAATGDQIVALEVHDGTERWRVEPSDPTGPPGYPTATVDGERVYVSTVGGPLVAVDRASGTERWRFDPATVEDDLPTDNRSGITSVAVPFRERVIVTSNRAVYTLDAATGGVEDRFQTSVGPGAVPVVAQGMVIVDLGPSVIGLDAASLQLRWQWTAPAAGARIGSHPVTPPTLHGDVVLVGGGDGTLAALDPRTGAPRWDLDLGAAVISRPGVSGNTIVVRTETGDIRAFDAGTGRARWRQALSPTALGDPALSGRTVYATDADELIALDLASGTERWRTGLGDDGLTVPLAVEDTVLVGTSTGELVAVDGAAGGIMWRHTVGAGISAPPAVTEDDVIVVTDAGTVVSLR
ncbi:MAG: PQQ-binding-like beta-propeller repeat protein [Actinobacteria bacterium]|nr:PQQ-binding-like beta-propeller repeat protein [Actinomycetota bacterium]